ncbi:MAG: hypothetical protein ABSG31_19045 [Tepidisphaeraceae bacterium]|jgi:cytochrome bd-type quinol oxidase subunit 2
MNDDPILDYERRAQAPEPVERQWSPLTVSILAVVFAAITFLGGARARSLREHFNILQLCIFPSIGFFVAAIHRASREVWRRRTNQKTIAAFGFCVLYVIVIAAYLAIYGRDG